MRQTDMYMIPPRNGFWDETSNVGMHFMPFLCCVLNTVRTVMDDIKNPRFCKCKHLTKSAINLITLNI